MKNRLIFFLLFISILTFGQTKAIDSLKASVNLKKQDTTLINIYWAIAKEYMSVNLDSFAKYVDELERLSLKNQNFKLARIYDTKALKYLYQNKLDSSEYYFKKALQLSNEKSNPIEKSTIYSNYSLMFQRKRELKKGVEYLKKAIDLVKNDSKEVCLLYFNLGNMYLDLELANEAKKYLKLAHINAAESNDLRVKGYALAALGHHFNSIKQKDSATYYLKKSIKVCEESLNPQICHIANLMLGELYLEEKKLTLAKSHILNTKKYAEIRNSSEDIMRSYMYLGRVEGLLGNYNNSVRNYMKFENLYDNSFFGNVGMNEFREWAKIESKRNNHKESTRLLNKYIVIKDSLYLKENRELLADLNKKYETEKKDKEILEQNLQIEKQSSELQKKKSQYTLMTGLAIFLLLTSVLTWFLYQQRQKRKNQEIVTLKREQQVKTLESLMEGEEKERIRIAQELHDGVNVDLSAIKYKLTSLLEKNNKVINEAVAMIDKSCEQVRAISHNLVPPALKDFSLVEALQDYCSTANTVHASEVSFQHVGDSISISKKAEVTIFRIVQELVNNSLKHAEASEIDVQISNRVGIIQITVEDNGKGFNKDEIVSNGIGLKNIHSRIAYLNAKLDFNSGKDGTSYTIDINIEGLAY